MYKKIQNFGLNKKVFNDQCLFVAKEALNFDEIKLNQHTELLRAFTEVSLYEWTDNAKKQFKKPTIDTIETFFGDLRKIDDISYRYANTPEFAIQENLKRFKQLNYFLRTEKISVSPEEEQYQKQVNEFEKFLLAYYEETLLPILEKSEKEIRETIIAIFEREDLTESQKIKEVEKYLDKQEKELGKEFDKQGDKMNEQAITTALALLAILAIPEPPTTDIKRYKKIFKKGYLSNIIGNLGTWFRQIRELFFDVTSLQRASEKSYLRGISMNRNNFKLSVISHPKGLLRAITNKTALKNGYTHFKALVPQWAVATLSPTGATRKYLYQIKTKDEWSNVQEATTPNVIDGLSIHHNDQIYYMPINNDQKQSEISKKQRNSL